MHINTSFVTMSSEGTLISELAKAKENIRRKYSALKQGEADTRSFVTQTLNPIIEPLKKIQKSIKYGKTFSKDNTAETLNRAQSEEEEEEDSYFKKNSNSEDVDSWFHSQDRDKTYGPRKLDNGMNILGNKELKFTDDSVILENTSYPKTSGIIQLIFSKKPSSYSDGDLDIYKSILFQSSAHLSTDGSKIKKTVGHKYKNIIAKLFTSGDGLTVNLQQHNLTYWDDPNELVDRLRLLVASRAAGNTGVSNEILSIYEELFEAGIIKRIPNV